MTDQPSERGCGSASPWHMPLGAWREVAIRTYKEASADNVGLVAAGVSFYSFLALFPLLGATVLVYGLVAEPATVVRHMHQLTAMLPADVARIIAEQLLGVVDTSAGKKGIALLSALAFAVFGARNAAGAIVTALNIAYEEEEKRGFLQTTLLALAITVCAVVVLVIALLSVATLGYLDELMPHSSGVLIAIGKFASYVLLAFAAAAAAATLYRYGPSRDRAQWIWLTPGSLLFAVAWVILTLVFGYYISRFGNYGATYGSLSAVVVLLTWLYLSSYALLFGGELNSELEHQTARDTTRGPDRPLGERGAWAADHVANGEAPNEMLDTPGASPKGPGPRVLGLPETTFAKKEPPAKISALNALVAGIAVLIFWRTSTRLPNTENERA